MGTNLTTSDLFHAPDAMALEQVGLAGQPTGRLNPFIYRAVSQSFPETEAALTTDDNLAWLAKPGLHDFRRTRGQ